MTDWCKTLSHYTVKRNTPPSALKKKKTVASDSDELMASLESRTVPLKRKVDRLTHSVGEVS